jgi:nucleotide-binding universal stress UspA family protein
MAGIVVGYDGSAGAEAALRSAFDLGKRLGERLTIVFGFEANPVGGEALDYWKAVREHGESVLATALEEAKAAGVEVESVVAEKAPSAALAEIAEERDASMIVVGSHGERPIAAAILGATPHRLLHISQRPVLVVRAPTS